MTAPFLRKELLTAALCWRIERRDGICIGFTTHDRDIPVAGLRYRSAPGMLPSAVALSDGFEADTLSVEGALTSGLIRSDDLGAGRWDGAALSLFMVDWERPEETQVPVARGELGDVTFRGESFEAELRGPTALLERPAVEQTSPECRAELGDRRCRVDMAARVRTTRVAAVIGEEQIEVSDAAGENAYGYGRLRWIGGRNSGLESSILKSEASILTLREAPPFPPAAGDLVEIREGCDKSLGTCSGRFENMANFRGEPHLPGMDLLTRYPGG
jgi:uncharacterized phage protein (TIGR02218 family)